MKMFDFLKKLRQRMKRKYFITMWTARDFETFEMKQSYKDQFLPKACDTVYIVILEVS